MQELLLRADGDNRPVLLVAQARGDIKLFEAVVICLEKHSTTEQVRVDQLIRWVELPTSILVGVHGGVFS